MRGFRYILAALLFQLAATFPLFAQDDDKGFLTRTLQDALSGAGRTVSIDGFRGALSSQASFDQMTIADDTGVWLTLRDVVLDWNRAALLRGRLEVTSLTAQRLDLPRLPEAEQDSLPQAEATPFSLPELPISVLLDEFSVSQINLGAPLLGDPVQLGVTAAARLDGDGANVDLTASRTDGQRGSFEIQANFVRTGSVLDLLLRLSEAEDGIAARLLNIPERPGVEMSVAGRGPLNDFATDLKLATDGIERVQGRLVLGEQAPENGSGAPDRRVQATVGGDITSLLAPRYREFFGTDISLTADALIKSDGRTDIQTFDLAAQAADLRGRVTLNAQNWPTLIDVTGTIENPDGTTILLPASGGTRVESVNLLVDYNVAQGDAINAKFEVSQLDVTGASVETAELTLEGVLEADAGQVGRFLGDVAFAANGLDFTDEALGVAVGDSVKGQTSIRYTEDRPLEISGLALSGEDYALSGDALVQGLDTGLSTELTMALAAADLSRFSGLAQLDLAGQTTLGLQGSVAPIHGMFDLRANGATQDLALGISQADAVLAGQTNLNFIAKRDETGTFLRDLVLRNAALDLTGETELRTGNSRAEARFELSDIALVLPQYSGPVRVRGTGVQDAQGWNVDAETDGPYGVALTVKGLATGANADLDFTADVPDIAAFVPEYSGPVSANGQVLNTENGWQLNSSMKAPYEITAAVTGFVAPAIDLRFDAEVPEISEIVPDVSGTLATRGTLRQTETGFFIDADAQGPFKARAKVEGAVTPALDLDFKLNLPNVSPIVAQIDGPLAATGSLKQLDDGLALEARANGPYAANANVDGNLTPSIDLSYGLNIPDLQPLVPQAKGALDARGRVEQRETGFFVSSQASGPYQSRAEIEGLATGPDMQISFDVGMPSVAPLAPGIVGGAAAQGIVRQTSDGISVDATATGPYSSRLNAQGVVTGPQPNVSFGLSMPDLGAVIDRINGPFDVTGTAAKVTQGWRLDTKVAGPSGTQADLAGVVGDGGDLNLDLVGSAPLGLSGPFLAPRDLQGLARFDLDINGPPALSSVSGTLDTANASFSAPNLRLALQNLDTQVRLANNRAQIGMSAVGTNGGNIRADGSVTLSGALPADLRLGVRDLVLIDPRLYRTSVNGDVAISGPLSAGAAIIGRVNLGETTINVPSTGLTSIGDIPPIDHIGATRPVMSTRRKAGIEDNAIDDASSQEGNSGGLALDVALNAPSRIFVRGRGLDAELGGALRLTGTTAQMISAGRFDLLRGRLDILGQRFDLREGSAEFQGDLIPFIRFVTATATQTGEVRVIVEGPADEPEVTFAATPDAPQDEVLAQLLFGRNVSEISPFQALQLANAVANLAGRGGISVISNLRRGFGLDDFDVTTTDSGATAVRAGKYISENVYTDVTAASDGQAEISLNLDITDSLTGKATLNSDGNSGIGIFFERDY